MHIGFIGAGKVGCSLGRYFSQHHVLEGYASTPAETAYEAAQLTNSVAYDTPFELVKHCDVIFFTTPDGIIAHAWHDLLASLITKDELTGKIVCHCSGSLASSIFDQADSYGACAYSLHPLFAVSSKTVPQEELSQAFFTLEGSPQRQDDMRHFIEVLGNPLQIIDATEKTRYHAAAALASNHVVALYRLACNELIQCGFSPADAEAALAPLFLGNAHHIAHDGVVAALTGPAERGDYETINKHLNCLEGTTQEVYKLLNETLLTIAQEKHGTSSSSQ